MKKSLLALGAACLVFWGQSAIALQRTPVTDFDTMDKFFIQQYGAENKAIGKKTRPIMVVNGFDYQLYLPDGSVKTFNGLVSPFNELKAVSHIGPALYAILSPAWKNPQDTSWKKTLADYQVLTKKALDQVNNIDWSNQGWLQDGEKVKTFMRDSLLMVNNFISSALTKDQITLKDYQTFAAHYMHTMIATMYLADVANTTSTLNQLRKWKKEMGGKNWDNLYVLILGSKGRTTSELSLSTSTVAITVSGLMPPEQAKTHIIIMPMAASLEEAEASLGAIINAQGLAEATFTTDRAKNATGIYKALKTADVPLARDNVAHITHQDVQHGNVHLPPLNILPQDKAFVDCHKAAH